MELAEIAKIVTNHLRTLGEVRPMRFDAKTSFLVVGEAPEPIHHIHLGAIQKEYQDSRGVMRHRALSRRLWSSSEPRSPPDSERLLNSLLPKLQHASWYDAQRQQLEQEYGPEAARHGIGTLAAFELNDELSSHLTIVLPTYVFSLPDEVLSSWGFPVDELFQRAFANLKNMGGLPFDNPEPGVYVSPYHDGYDATRLHFGEEIAALKLQGKPVAIAPTHDLLFVTGDEDTKGLTTITAWALEAMSEPQMNIGLAFRLEEGTWRRWVPPRDHPASDHFHDLEVMHNVMFSELHEIAG